MAKDPKQAEFQIITYGNHPVLDECVSILKKDAKRTLKVLTKSNEVIKTHKENNKILFVYYLDHLKRIKDLLRLVNYLKINKPAVNYNVCVVGSVQHPKLLELLGKMGCPDYIQLAQAPRAVRMKLNRLIERLETDKNDLKGGHSSERTAKSGKVTRIGPFESQYDYWVYQKWSVFKKVMGQWLFEMKGPSPNVGRWMEPETEGEWSDGCYWWTPHDMDYPLFKGQTGIWIFKSKNPPEHKDNHWSFVGPEPQFIYLDPIQKTPRYKVKTTSDGNLEVTANSKIGESLVPLIEKTYEYELKIKTTRPGGVSSMGDVISLPNDVVPAGVKAADLSTHEIKEIDQLMFELEVSEANETLDDEETGFFNTDGADSDPLFAFDKPKKEDPAPDLIFNKDIFKKVADAKVQESFLSESEKKFKTSVIWTHGRKHMVSVKSTKFDQKNKKITFNLNSSPDLMDLFDQINEQTIPAVYFNVTLPRSAVFLNMASKDLKVKGTSLEYSFKEEMWQVQRRKNFRYEFMAHDSSHPSKLVNQKTRVTFAGKTDTYQLADVSATGARIIITPQDAITWAKGVTLNNVELSVGGKAISTKALIRWSKKLNTPYAAGNHQVGVEFIGISKEDQKWINDQILTELNDYFKTFPMQT